MFCTSEFIRPKKWPRNITTSGLEAFLMMIFQSIHLGSPRLEIISESWSRKMTAYDEFYWNLNFPDMDECKHCYPLATATPTEQNMIRYGSSKFWNKKAADKLGLRKHCCGVPIPQKVLVEQDSWVGTITVTGRLIITGNSFLIPLPGWPVWKFL